MSEKKISKPMELTDDELDMVTGGAYVNTSMTIEQIVGTDRELMGVMINAGIPVMGNKGILGQSLMEVASKYGIDANVLEDKMNDYLSCK